MTWRDSRPEYRDPVGHCVVGRPALVMEFHGNNRESKLKRHGNTILERFLALLPAGQELHLLARSNAREYKKVGPQRIGKVREELKKEGGFFSFKTSPGFDVGEFSIELHVGCCGKWGSDTVMIGFPIAWGGSPKAGEADAFFRSLAADIPFSWAIAGFGFDIVWGRDFELIAMVENFRQARRYQGLLMRNRMQEDFMCVNENGQPVDKIKSAGWMTFLGPVLGEQAGGAKRLAKELGSSIEVSEIGKGLLIKTNETPPEGDREHPNGGIDSLRLVGRVLSGITLAKWEAPMFGVSFDIANAWLHRFD